MKKISITVGLILCCYFLPKIGNGQTRPQIFVGTDPVALFKFDGNSNATLASVSGATSGKVSFAKGLDGKALSLGSEGPSCTLALESKQLPFDPGKDFSIQFWIRSTIDPKNTAVILSQKEFHDNSLASQKNPGWVFYMYDICMMVPGHGIWDRASEG